MGVRRIFIQTERALRNCFDRAVTRIITIGAAWEERIVGEMMLRLSHGCL